jgi:hypothetical protein
MHPARAQAARTRPGRQPGRELGDVADQDVLAGGEGTRPWRCRARLQQVGTVTRCHREPFALPAVADGDDAAGDGLLERGDEVYEHLVHVGVAGDGLERVVERLLVAGPPGEHQVIGQTGLRLGGGDEVARRGRAVAADEVGRLADTAPGIVGAAGQIGEVGERVDDRSQRRRGDDRRHRLADQLVGPPPEQVFDRLTDPAEHAVVVEDGKGVDRGLDDGAKHAG